MGGHIGDFVFSFFFFFCGSRIDGKIRAVDLGTAAGETAGSSRHHKGGAFLIFFW
jgi:hypothetical protein